jgi:Fungal chitosanase of glycosyl hydrolase group 75/D-alanyl-D-alanine carboxypeptidase
MAARLTDLVPSFREKIGQLLQKCSTKGVTMVPSEAVRSPHQQAIYWRQSRSTSEINSAIAMLRNEGAPYLADVLEGVGPHHGDEVTKVLPGNSWHQWGEAIDCFWEVDGQAEWSTTKKINGINGFQLYAEEAKGLGLDPGLLWRSFKDAPHVQLRSTANPRASGLNWSAIDAAMRERFGTAPPVPTPDLRAADLPPAPSDAIRSSYEAPEGWKVFETIDVGAAVFRAKMAICADGAPKAYNRNDAIALDFLANAGRPGNWWALVTDGDGDPVVQSQSDPAPGYFVSTTALTNPSTLSNKPAHFVDASTIPFIVLPGRRFSRFTTTRSLRLGDVGVAYNIRNGKISFAQFAETGPADKIGEASIALADALSVNSNPKTGGTSLREIVYVVFPGSGIGCGLSMQEINTRAEPIFNNWGGLARIRSCAGL